MNGWIQGEGVRNTFRTVKQWFRTHLRYMLRPIVLIVSNYYRSVDIIKGTRNGIQVVNMVEHSFVNWVIFWDPILMWWPKFELGTRALRHYGYAEPRISDSPCISRQVENKFDFLSELLPIGPFLNIKIIMFINCLTWLIILSELLRKRLLRCCKLHSIHFEVILSRLDPTSNSLPITRKVRNRNSILFRNILIIAIFL